MEIEAIKIRDMSKEQLAEQCNKYMELFGISASNLLSVSYSDLLLAKANV
ncbi:MAG: hypothetical protein ABR981_04220 [Candidatus Micrarchaeaceae archaeon]